MKHAEGHDEDHEKSKPNLNQLQKKRKARMMARMRELRRKKLEAQSFNSYMSLQKDFEKMSNEHLLWCIKFNKTKKNIQPNNVVLLSEVYETEYLWTFT